MRGIDGSADDHGDVLSFDSFRPDDELRRESILGLGNGALFVRASAPEARLAAPCSVSANGIASQHYPGIYRAGLYDLSTAKANGAIVRTASVPRLPNATVLAIRRPGGAWLGSNSAELVEYRHALDLCRGLALRTLVLRDASGTTTQIDETRFVSYANPFLIVLRWTVTACDWEGLIDIGTGTDANVCNGIVDSQRPLESAHIVDASHADTVDGLSCAVFRLAAIPVTVAVAARVDVDGQRTDVAQWQAWDEEHARFRLVRMPIARRTPLRIDRIVAVKTSRDVASAHPVDAACNEVRGAPHASRLQDAHRRAWTPGWEQSRIDSEDAALRLALNVRAFHVRQTVSPISAHEDLGIPARGWQEGYNGHVFWDDLFVLPEGARTQPALAKGPLMYRYERLDAARRAASSNGLRGALYPWRSATTGDEETPDFRYNPLDGHWMRDNTHLERHVGASIAWNIVHYVRMSGDDVYLRTYGAEMMVEIARMWASLSKLNATSGRYDIGGVIGPDEYHDGYPGAAAPGLLNNAYTNVMAMWTLRSARDILDELPAEDRAALVRKVDLAHDEPECWRTIASRLSVPFFDDGSISQFEGFDTLREVSDPRSFSPGHSRTDWFVETKGGTTNAWQLVKQPDVLMLFYLLRERGVRSLLEQAGYRFGREAAQRSLEQCLGRMTHESSLSRIVCAGALAGTDPKKSLAFFRRALETDHVPASGSAQEGLHLGSHASLLNVVLHHYAGVRYETDAIAFEPGWPPGLPRVRMGFNWRGQRFVLCADAAKAELHAAHDNDRTVDVRLAERTVCVAPGDSVNV
ncbi:glycosyl hydrolase family 65 protein [Paraburkholderia sp. XV]|uniref:glycosyl hydrolase family 65 protein n=1 Tax=Paraburkholderia sp. XV TaxID=2831520 RepID=UPI001CD7230A|nr:glycosyl hydrolase family 65 protein [Paraburkholderia sp. XV]